MIIYNCPDGHDLIKHGWCYNFIEEVVIPFFDLWFGGSMTLGIIKTSYISNKYDNCRTSYQTVNGSVFADELSKAEMRQIVDDRMEFLVEKIKNGDTEVSYRIGASSFTEREWNKIIEKYDDIQEKLKELMREEYKNKTECKKNIKIIKKK